MIGLIDSRSAYYCLSKELGNSIMKTARWRALIQTRYPRLVLHFVSGDRNPADFLSRNFQVPDKLPDKLKPEEIDIAPVTALDGQTLTIKQAQEVVDQHPGLVRKKQAKVIAQVAQLSLDEVAGRRRRSRKRSGLGRRERRRAGRKGSSETGAIQPILERSEAKQIARERKEKKHYTRF